MFSVFVYDRTSRSEVTCLGLEAMGEMPTQELPPEVQKFIGNDENANALYCADLNGDGLPDYLLVTTTQDHLSGRSMKVLIRRPNGQLDLAVGNTHALQPPSFDGINGAPDLLVRRNKFQILNNSAGSGGSTEHVFYFEFSKPENTWLLTRMDFDIQGAGPDYLHPYSLRPKQTTINDFDVRKYQD